MWIKKLSLVGILISLSSSCSCSTTNHFLNEFNVGDGIGWADGVISYSHLWYGNSLNKIDDENSNHTYELKFGEIDKNVYACYVPTSRIDGYINGVKHQAGEFGTRFDLNKKVVDGKILWLFQEVDNFPVTRKEVPLDELSFIDGEETLIFACEKQKATIAKDLFTRETINKDIEIYTMLDLVGNENTKKFDVVKRNVVEGNVKEWISLPQDFDTKLICSPYFSYTRQFEARVKIEIINGNEVVALPIASKHNNSYTSLFDDISNSVRLGDVYENQKEQFKKILLNEEQYPYFEKGEDKYGYYKVSDIVSLINELHNVK